MADPCRFDDSLPRLLQILVTNLGKARVETGVVLRDATGRLGFFARDNLEVATLQQIDEPARAALGPYARTDRVIAGASDPGAQRALNDPGALALSVDLGGDGQLTVQYLDRRIVGADWLYRPAPPVAVAEDGAASATPGAVRVAFSSLKGGVGRSTALTVVAAEQARRGRNVLVVDLDLEAPGIGSLLLSEDRMPSFGVIDYLVERNFGQVDRAMLADMVGTSALTQGQGLVSVVPAVGTRTLQVPSNYFAKVSRAMIEAVTGEEGPVSVAAKLRGMLNDLEALRRYDVVLIDVRAGLAEISAGPLLALDAEVLIFGTNQQQTIQDLRFLFAHLTTLTDPAHAAQWNRLKMVHAKAQPSAVKSYRDEMWELFADYLYVEAVDLDEFNFDADAEEAPHFPIVIPLDTAFADWDPVKHPEMLMEEFYAPAFKGLIRHIDDLLTVDQADVQD